MLLETIETKGVAHLSYVVGDDDEGVCAVIDPRRDVSIYIDIARQNNCRITHIFETHIHADFVSGARELASQTGAQIVGGVSKDYGFKLHQAKEGETFELGAVTLQVLHTPGHTPEHISLSIEGGKGSKKTWGVFTGDTLFAGEVGRPDLIGGGSEEELAKKLFHSLHEKLFKLGDEVEIYPAHGSGSPCGGNIGDRLTSTIGYERHASGEGATEKRRRIRQGGFERFAARADLLSAHEKSQCRRAREYSAVCPTCSRSTRKSSPMPPKRKTLWFWIRAKSKRLAAATSKAR